MKTAKLLKIYMKAQECSSPKQAKKLIKKYNKHFKSLSPLSDR